MHSRMLALSVLLLLPVLPESATAELQPPFEGRLTFASNRDGDFEVFVMDVDGTDRQKLTKNSRDDRSPSWRGDGSKVVFSRQMKRWGNIELFSLRLMNRKEWQLTHSDGVWELEPAWSSDETLIAFESEGAGGDGSDLMLLGQDGESEGVAWQEDNSENGDAAWSADGENLAYLERYDAGDLFAASFDGAEWVAAQLTTDDAWKDSPRWHPDGDSIAVAVAEGDTFGGPYDIYLVPLDGGEWTPLLVGEGSQKPSAWTDDGRYLIYEDDATGNFDIWALDVTTGDKWQLTDHPDDEVDADLWQS